MLQVNAVDTSLITIETPDSDQVSNIASYPIRLQLTSSLWERSQLETLIEISCPLTGHSQTVSVEVKLVGSKETQQKLGAWFVRFVRDLL